jgi:rubrerythrin
MEQPIFRASEIFEMAVEIEYQGVAFYRAARANSPPEVNQVLDILIEQQLVHAQVFSRMRDELNDDFFLPESYPGERKMFINGFVKDQVFLDPLQALQQFEKVKDYLETIRIAIEYELRSILFYSWMKHIVRGSDGEAIDRIITEEHTHISRLLKLRQDFYREVS